MNKSGKQNYTSVAREDARGSLLASSQKSSHDIKTLWKVFGGVGLLLAVVFSWTMGELVGKISLDSHRFGRKEGFVDEALLKTESDDNSKLPMIVDPSTRLDSTVRRSGHVRYNYTLVNYASSSISASDLENALVQKLRNDVCTSKEMQAFVKSGVTVSYAYFGNDGKQITVISVTPSQCGST